METCELYRLIPKEKLDYLFSHSHAGAELDPSFLGFEDIYRDVVKYISSDTTIIDLGCGYATQSYYFTNCCQYIGIDVAGNHDSVIHTDNSSFYFVSIQDFVENFLPRLNLDLNKVFAVCSYVPDARARDLVVETFPNCRVYYPGSVSVLNLSETFCVKPALDEQIAVADDKAKQTEFAVQNAERRVEKAR